MMNTANKLGVVLVTGFAAAACGSESGPLGSGYEELPADAVMTNVLNPMFADGVRTALGQYDSVYLFMDSTRVRGVHVELFGPDGQPSGTLEAESGVIENQSQEMVAYGSVKLLTADGLRTIETEELHYDPGARELWSDVATCMVEDGQVSRGSSFRSDDRLVEISIVGLSRAPGTSCS